MAVATPYQRWGVQHVLNANKPRFAELYEADYRAVSFMPQDTRTAKFIAEAKHHLLHAGVWFVDPASTDSGMSGNPETFADQIVTKVRELDAHTEIVEGKQIKCGPEFVIVNIEFTGKGYPTRKPNTIVKAWHRCVAGGWEWQTFSDGTTGTYDSAPNFVGSPGAFVNDGNVVWHALNPAAFNGWDWNEKFMARIRRKVSDGGMPTRMMYTQPMGHQADFNYGAYLKEREYNRKDGIAQLSPPARISPQCYAGDMTPYDLKSCIDEIVSNGYVKSYYGITVPRSYIHPSIAPSRSGFYRPLMPLVGGVRGYTLFREDYMNADDFAVYQPYMLT